MMFEFNGETYRVDFEYGHRRNGHNPLTNVGNKRIRTTAIIAKRLGPKQYENLSTGYSHRDGRDQFRKSIGRRLALSRATKALNNRQLATKTWEEYFKNHTDGKELKLVN